MDNERSSMKNCQGYLKAARTLFGSYSFDAINSPSYHTYSPFTDKTDEKAVRKQQHGKKTEPLQTVATRIGSRRKTRVAVRETEVPSSWASAAAASAGNSPRRSARTSGPALRRQKSVIDLDEGADMGTDQKAPSPEPAPAKLMTRSKTEVAALQHETSSTECKGGLSSVRVYVIPVNMDRVIFNLCRDRVLQLQGEWLGPKTKVLSTDPRIAHEIPPLDQERTTHIITELTSVNAVKTYFNVETIKYKKPMDPQGYLLSRLVSHFPAPPTARSPLEETPPPSQQQAQPAGPSKPEKERFAKFESTEDGQQLEFHEILQGIQEGSLDDGAISEAGETEDEHGGHEQVEADVGAEDPDAQGSSKVAELPAGDDNTHGMDAELLQKLKNENRCFRCHEQGHWMRRCPHHVPGKTKDDGKRRAKILYQCQSPHVNGQKEEPIYNKAILEQLKILMDYYDNIKYKGSKEHFKVINYRKAITAIRALDYEITSEAMALKVPRVGKKIAQKIGECIALGKIKKLEHLNWDEERSKVETLFRSIYGVGSEKATEWYNKGLRTLDDVRKLPDLTKNQISGLKYYDDLLKRIPRAEVTEIGKVVESAAKKLHPDIQVNVTGSYRRGQPDCGDIDMVIARPNIDHGGDLFLIMDHILKELIDQGFLVDHLSLPVWSDEMQSQLKHFKYMGICKLPGENQVHHHIDILVVPWMHLGAVLLYFTGNDICNRSMRLLASNRGMRLSDKGLFAGVIRGKNRKKINEGHWVAGRTEKEIFDYLKIKYLEPHEREC
ncbi:hypothetical protein BGX28_001841 [Mortierella sp. GBA30]|nr:hypothetical protein BGX28_001841 [Mortierella sp. GBA30]